MANRSLKEWRRIYESTKEKLVWFQDKDRQVKDAWKDFIRLEKELLKQDTEHRRNRLEVAKRRLERIIERKIE